MASDDSKLRVHRDDGAAGGPKAALSTLRHGAGLGPVRALRLLSNINQVGGFDCPGCAWPDPADRSAAEFCENGVKHVAHEARTAVLDGNFFAMHSVEDLRGRSDRWLEAQGRLVEPMILREGAAHYEPIDWDAAFARLSEAIRGLGSPDEAVFYTSGRTSNEAAFLYQLFARQLGTNNLPDCSNMCHESSGTALNEAIGVGKGTVSLDDFDRADLIFVWGQNPGTNHPRMLTTLERAAKRGAHIVSVNPLRERGLVSFAHPKNPLGLLGRGTLLARDFLQVRVGGDVALLKGLCKALLELEERESGRVLDADFLRDHTGGFEAYRDALAGADWDAIERDSGIARARIREIALVYARAERVIVCWAMGLTQHEHGVANVQEIVNLLLLRGQLGVPGAGVCPVRGHSNVQGDRTMGIWERPPADFLDALGREFDFEPPREPGLDTLAAIHAMREGRARVFVGMGGNFAVATPDSEVTHAALSRCDLTVQVSITLNRSHLVVGREALILPCLGRTERDQQQAGAQFVTVENSMSEVHASQGRLGPAGRELRSEPAIVAGMARAVLGPDNPVPWEHLVEDYDRIRERIARVVPGFEDMNARVRKPGGFLLPSGARTRDFETPDGRAHFTVHDLPELALGAGRLRMMTLRSHDQFNTTIYSDDDRYRGIEGDRRVVLLNTADVAAQGLSEGQRVDVTSHHRGEKRTVRGFAVVTYDLPSGCAGMYFPEANPLVPVEQFARRSRTPAYKSVEISLAPSA